MSNYQCGYCLEQFTFDQYIKLDHKWIDPKKKNYGKTTICKCGMNFYPNWQIQSLKEDYLVSTIHTSLGLISNLDFFDNTTDYFYETMIFDQKNNNWLPFLARYKTREQAIEGHKLAYDNLSKIMLNPQSYPQGIITMFCNMMEMARDQNVVEHTIKLNDIPQKL